MTTVPAVDQELTVMGWGLLKGSDTSLPDILQSVNVTAISNEKCDRGVWDGRITPDMLCATGFNLTGSCNGDSGGPLIVPGATYEDDVQVGIVSFGFPGCLNRE